MKDLLLRWGGVRVPLVAALCLLVAGCVRVNVSHCGNLSGDATCAAWSQDTPYCSVCVAENEGCVASPPPTDCRQDGVAGTSDGTTAAETGEPGTTAVPDVGDTGGSETMEVPLPVCGNGVIEEGEYCDSDNLGGESCVTQQGHEGGTLLCSEECRYDFSQCEGESTCGDDTVDYELGEDCEGDSVDQTCADYKGDAYAGLLFCVDCQIVATECCLTLDQECRADEDCCTEKCAGLLILPTGLVAGTCAN
jgi:hypothetical protein